MNSVGRGEVSKIREIDNIFAVSTAKANLGDLPFR